MFPITELVIFRDPPPVRQESCGCEYAQFLLHVTYFFAHEYYLAPNLHVRMVQFSISTFCRENDCIKIEGNRIS